MFLQVMHIFQLANSEMVLILRALILALDLVQEISSKYNLIQKMAHSNLHEINNPSKLHSQMLILKKEGMSLL